VECDEGKTDMYVQWDQALNTYRPEVCESHYMYSPVTSLKAKVKLSSCTPWSQTDRWTNTSIHSWSCHYTPSILYPARNERDAVWGPSAGL